VGKASLGGSPSEDFLTGDFTKRDKNQLLVSPIIYAKKSNMQKKKQYAKARYLFHMAIASLPHPVV
jgi:hypothetical protein